MLELNSINYIVEKVYERLEQEQQVSGLLKEQLNLDGLVDLKTKLKSNEYIVTVIGAMKSGKSSFVNALLGEDLMPNENQACTLTTTNIIHFPYNKKIIKIYENGKEEIFEGENIASVFHEDIRKSRNLNEHSEYFTYMLHHELEAFQDINPKANTRFILMDTPGLNEMEGLGVTKEKIENVFSKALRCSDAIIYILDVQYYKSDENQMILNKIKCERPDLLSSITYIINKIDLIRERDGDIETIKKNVKTVLNAWNIDCKRLYAVSSRKALLGRLIKKGRDINNYDNELPKLLSIHKVEINGKIRAIRAEPSESYNDLINSSNLPYVEQEVLVHLMSNIEKFKFDNNKLRFASEVDQITKELDTIKDTLVNSLKKKSKRLQFLDNQLFSIRAIKDCLDQTQKEIESLISDLIDETYNEKPYHYSKTTHKPREIVSSYEFDSENAAKQTAIKIFKDWFDPRITHLKTAYIDYSRKIEYRNHADNYYYKLNVAVSKKLNKLNQVVEEYSSNIKGEFIPSVLDDVRLRPELLKEMPVARWNRSAFESRIKIGSHTTTQEKSFLIVIKWEVKTTTYSFNISDAVNEARKFIENTLEDKINAIHRDYIVRKQDYLEKISNLVKSQLEMVKGKIDPIFIKMNEEFELIQQHFKNNSQEIQQIKTIISELTSRADLFLERKSKIVTAADVIPLNKIMCDIKSGTTLFLEPGIYNIDALVELNKSIAIIGENARNTVIKFKGDSSQVKYACNMFILQNVTLEVMKIDNCCLSIDSLDVLIKNCQFLGSEAKGVALKIKGQNIALSNCEFSNFGLGALLDSCKELSITNSLFSNNDKGLLLENVEKSVVSESNINNNKTGVIFCNRSCGELRNNTVLENSIGVKLINETKVVVCSNDIIKNLDSGILITDDAKGNINSNNIRYNGTGISCNGKSDINVYGNNIEENGNGISLKDNCFGDITKNLCNTNEIGMSISGNSDVIIEDNHCSYNNNGIYAEDYANILIKNNKCLANKGCGFLLKNSVKGHALNNTCNENLQGISVNDQAEINLENNTCNENVEDGLKLSGHIRGTIARNNFNKNGKFGIHLTNKVNVDLKDNVEADNKISVWLTFMNSCRKYFSKYKTS